VSGQFTLQVSRCRSQSQASDIGGMQHQQRAAE